MNCGTSWEYLWVGKASNTKERKVEGETEKTMVKSGGKTQGRLRKGSEALAQIM